MAGVRVTVRAGCHSYPVLIGSGVRNELADVLVECLPQRPGRVAMVTQAGIDIAVDPGVEHRVFTIPDGEASKTLETVETLCREFTRWGLTRGDVVVAVGGGLVTDVGGFAAAVFHRGLPVVHVATTYLAMVDAAIGGKVGVNLPEGRNLVGAFWQPSAVLCDIDALITLPEREMRSGLGEVAKYELMAGERFDEADRIEQIVRCVAMKGRLVEADPGEAIVIHGRRSRAVLNYGHTLAHALETASGYDLRHGEAVGIGLVYAAEVAFRLGRIDRARVDEHRHVVAGYGLSTTLPEGIDERLLLDLVARDKKSIHAPTFALDGPDGVEPVSDVPPGVLAEALVALRGDLVR